MISNKEVSKVVILYKDRLMRFGYDMFSYFCELNDTEIEIIDHTETTGEQELTEDLIQIVTGFSINGASLKPLKIQVVECHKKNNLNSRMRRNEKWQSNMTKNLRNR